MSIAALALAALAGLAQENVEFRGSGWVNSKDLHLDRLRGKVVVLYFFEEG